MLRLLDPPLTDANADVAAAKAIAKNSRVDVSRRLAGRFMRTYAGLFKEDDTRGALSALESILGEAAELSWNLWTRKARLKSELPGLGEFEYHPLHLRELDDDPEALDGRDMVVLCDAAITLRGTAEGQDFHQRRVVKKAVIWMG